MGILTGFYQIPAEATHCLTEESISRLLYPAGEDSVPVLSGRRVPHLAVDKAWEDIRRLVRGVDERAASSGLECCTSVIFNDYHFYITVYTSGDVTQGATAFREISLSEIRREALRRELTTYSGDPIVDVIDYVLFHFGRLIQFWIEAATADNAIVSVSG